jgi:hypothetical protein
LAEIPVCRAVTFYFDGVLTIIGSYSAWLLNWSESNGKEIRILREPASFAVTGVNEFFHASISNSNSGRDYHTDEHVVGYYNAGDRLKYRGEQGAFWGGIWGMLFGAAFFAIPGIGPVLVAGPLVAWIVGAPEGAIVVGGLSALGAGLYSIGIPKNSIVKYESALRSDKFLFLVQGTAAEVAKARDIMKTTHPVEVAVHGEQREQFAGISAR